MSTTYKVGVIGVGGIASTHMPGWNAAGMTEVVAAGDIDRAAVEKFGAEWKVPGVTTDAADLFRNPDIDIIDICTPNMYHAPLVIAAMEAGKHVICEKPLAPTPAEIRRHDRRARPGKQAADDRPALPLQGQLQGPQGRDRHRRAGRHLPCPQLDAAPSAAPDRLGFIQKKHSGGGPCIDIGVHILDLTLWMMGNPKPVAVTGVARRRLAHHRAPSATGRRRRSPRTSTSRTSRPRSCASRTAPPWCWR